MLHQAEDDRAGFISGQPFGTRVIQVPKQLLIGYSSPAQLATGIAVTLLFLVGVWLVVKRGSERERSRARLAALVAAVVIAVPLVLAIGGLDYLITRNLIAAAVPVLLIAAIGFATARAGRLGLGACAALVAISVGVYIGQEADRAYQRDNWRDAISKLGDEPGRAPWWCRARPACRPRACTSVPRGGIPRMPPCSTRSTSW